MTTFINKPIKAVVTGFVLAGLAGCIGSPFGPGAVAQLYRWDDRQSAVATRSGMESEEEGGYFNGDFDFTDVLESYPELADSPEDPVLLKACEEEVCYSVVLFGDFFAQNKEGLLEGYASMNGLTTAMANQVLSLPKDEVRMALDTQAGRLTADGTADYYEFLQLDPERKRKHRQQLLNGRVYATANQLVVDDPGFTVDDLLGESSTDTEDLVVPDGFDFNDSFVLSVDVDVSRDLDEDAYLLLCSEYEASGGGYEVNFDACQLNTPLIEGRYVGDLTMTGSTTNLLAVILPLQNPDEPIYALWSRRSDGENLRI